MPANAAEICTSSHFLFPPYLGPPSELFFSVPGSPTHAKTLPNATTEGAQINRQIASEWVCICKPTRQTIRDSYNQNAETPSSRTGLLPAAVSWSRLGSPCWGAACPAKQFETTNHQGSGQCLGMLGLGTVCSSVVNKTRPKKKSAQLNGHTHINKSRNPTIHGRPSPADG